MKIKSPDLKKIHELFDIIHDLEFMHGLEIEVKVADPKKSRWLGKGIGEKLINAQNESNKITRKRNEI